MNLIAVKSSLNEGKSIFDLPLRVVYYARVSTDKDEQLHSLDNQIFYFEDYIKKNENWTYAGNYVDEGISGTSVKKRDSFMKMIREAKNKKFDLIITKEISRFSRNTLDSIKYTQKLLDYGVGVYFQSDNINTLLPDSELRLTIMSSIAQEEVRKLSERLRFGYKRSIEQGRVLGQDNIFGYNKSEGRLTIDEEQAAVVKRIFEMYNGGKLGVRRIARDLETMGIVSPNTGKMFPPDSIRNIIQNPKYKGYYCSRKTVSMDYRNNKRIHLADDEWIVYKDENIPAIVSEEVWDKANKLYKERGKKSKENASSYLQRYTFSGKIICGEHGTSYHRHIYKSKKKGEQEVWNCKLYRQKGKLDGCDSPTIYSDELKKILTDIYSSVYKEKDKVINGLMDIYSSIDEKDYSKDIRQKEKDIESIKAKKDKLLELNMEDLITKAEFAERNNKLNVDVQKILSEISSLEDDMNSSLSSKENLAELKKALEQEFKEDDNFNSELSNVLLDKIIVHKVDGEKTHLQLEIILSLGNSYIAEVNKNNFISLDEIGISQAQVSRLEKCAMHRIKKND